jgi:transaldolase
MARASVNSTAPSEKRHPLAGRVPGPEGLRETDDLARAVHGSRGTNQEANVHPTRSLRDLGQSLWLDNITRDLLEKGTLKRYIEELSVTGLTSNPTIFDHAITHSSSYDGEIRRLAATRLSTEAIFFELALQDLARAADLFAPIHGRTAGVDGFVSLEVSPLLAYDTAKTVEQAKELHRKAARQNLLIKIPGTKEGLPAIEEAIFSGIPINVTLLFSREHYLATADAYLRGIERRIAEGLSPDVRSVASLFLSRWDVAVSQKVPPELRNRLGVAVGRQVYQAYRDVLASDRFQRLANAGARPQRLLFASTGTKDPKASDVFYVQGLAAPNTVDTMPEKTLLAFAEHGPVTGAVPRDGGDAEQVLAAFNRAGVDLGQLAAQLQEEGAKAFVGSWKDLMAAIENKGKQVR